MNSQWDKYVTAPLNHKVLVTFRYIYLFWFSSSATTVSVMLASALKKVKEVRTQRRVDATSVLIMNICLHRVTEMKTNSASIIETFLKLQKSLMHGRSAKNTGTGGVSLNHRTSSLYIHTHLHMYEPFMTVTGQYGSTELRDPTCQAVLREIIHWFTEQEKWRLYEAKPN